MIRRYLRLCVFAYEYFIFLGRVTNPSAKPPFLEDQFVSLSLVSLLWPVRLGRPYQERKVPRWHRDLWNTNKNKTGSTILQEWTSPGFLNMPLTTNHEEEEIMDAPGNDGNASMPEQVNRPNPYRKMMMMMLMMMSSKPVKCGPG